MGPGWEALADAARLRHLRLLGGFRPGPQDDAPEGCVTLLLLGPDEPGGFWEHFTDQPEYRDGLPDPMDRWSARVIGAWADDLGARALYPFGGAPYHPFYRWAVAAGVAAPSPVRLLCGPESGLFVSFRGALALNWPVALPAPSDAPCEACAAPCATACPVGALTRDGYDVPRCKAYLETPADADCLHRGCAVRRSCPPGAAYGRVEGQSAFHMRHFL
ncbi:ferredoxin [Maritimibacter alkaliphilus]|uniref:ferredoxin n=1 Tax=Maritimibacter alkaliphilus TaxID=404236 RepID=UPI001C9765C6|nr:ferredoxin [Maritimibacter alkaliphilus]MBY6091476.1 ferredoxin [Maritimibacter alkaliphilus]